MGQVLTLKEVATYLKVSKDTIKRHVKKGNIPCFKIGRNYRFDKDVIDAWLRGEKN